MIKARLTARSGGSDTAARDDAIRYLLRQVKTKEWERWKKSADITVVQKRDAGGSFWLASTTMVCAEDPWVQ